MQLEINNTTKNKINKKILAQAALIFDKNFKIGDKAVSVAIVGDTAIKNLNKKYRNKDNITDVLSFSGDKNSEMFGEIIICYSQIKRQAKKLNVSVRDELIFIFIHGLLHLAGYDDNTKKGWQEMEEIGSRLCKSVIAGKA